MHPLRLNRPIPPRQRGAFAVLTVSVLLLLVVCVALAVDTGRLYLEQRHMQRVADMAALEAAGAVMLISQATDDELTEVAKEAARRNGHDIDSGEDERTLSVVGGGICHEIAGEGQARVFFPLAQGSAECGEGYAGTLERHALEVTASHTVSPSLFGSLLGDDVITISATAMAQRSQAEPYAVFSLGSRLLSLDTNASPLLGPLLNSLGLNVDADLVSFAGIADVTVTLSDILDISGLNIGSVDELLAADVTLLQLIEAAEANLVGNELANLQLLSGLLDTTVGGLAIPLGELLDVSTTSVPLAAELNLLDLLSAGLLAANQTSAVELENLELDIPGLADFDVLLDIIEPPQIAIGPVGCEDGSFGNCTGYWKTEARTAQLRLGVGANLTIPVLADVGLRLGVTAAGARAGIENVEQPAEGANYDWDVDVAAYQIPLSAGIDLKLDVLGTSLPLLDPDLDGSGIPLLDDFLQSLDLGGLLNGLLSVVGDLLSGVLDLLGGLLGGLLGSVTEYYDTDNDEVCIKVTGLLGIPLGEECNPAPQLDDEDELGSGGQTPGWSEGMTLESWLTAFESATYGSPMSPPLHELAWSSASLEENVVEFTGSAGTLLDLDLPNSLNLQVDLLGLGTGDLLDPVLSIVDGVVGNIVGNLVGSLLDPLLEALGANTSNAEVHVIDINYHTGPPELL